MRRTSLVFRILTFSSPVFVQAGKYRAKFVAFEKTREDENTVI